MHGRYMYFGQGQYCHEERQNDRPLVSVKYRPKSQVLQLCYTYTAAAKWQIVAYYFDQLSLVLKVTLKYY